MKGKVRGEGEDLEGRAGPNRFRKKGGRPQGTRVSTYTGRQVRRQEMSGLASGGCEGEGGDLK